MAVRTRSDSRILGPSYSRNVAQPCELSTSRSISVPFSADSQPEEQLSSLLEPAARRLRGRFGRLVYVSSIAVPQGLRRRGIREESPVTVLGEGEDPNDSAYS